MKVKLTGLRKSGRARPAGSKRRSLAVRRLKVVKGARQRRGGSLSLRKRRGIRSRYRLRRGGRVFYPASSQAFNQGYNQAYDEGFKSGFAKGYEDGQTPPAPV
ncbi:hypothetical protein PAEVO_56360 [Paenibacillus sp. GM2FR]|uniref:hypothetical protein n=1 Tax=Paenibacillus sp. GM2FR TaxID=2059268 RepID=UPI000C271A08|nr:hypothetical protein [Paenibacillus sp. GM2FR]PJN50592.1 hypothetical protein PAEVO_56360 [Paenibacillus sp. GM2FR]